MGTDATQASPIYRPAGRISGKGPGKNQFAETLCGLAIDGRDRIYAAGDAKVSVFASGGELLRQWTTRFDARCVAVDERDRVWVGQNRQVEIRDPRDGSADAWRDPERLGLITAIGFHGSDVFLADATARCIRRYDRNGVFRNDIGDKHRKGGFHIPNGIVDFAMDDKGIVHVANPGMHRVERYTPEGKLLGHFGRFDGRDPQGFPGCCNPTNLTLDRAGNVIVSEKAGPRAKVYDPTGRLLAVVAADTFDPGAKNMDLAIDSSNRIYVADTVRLEIRVFEQARAEAVS